MLCEAQGCVQHPHPAFSMLCEAQGCAWGCVELMHFPVLSPWLSVVQAESICLSVRIDAKYINSCKQT